MKCIIKMISCYDCSQMLRISLKTENSLSPTPSACTSFFYLKWIHCGWSTSTVWWGQRQLLVWVDVVVTTTLCPRFLWVYCIVLFMPQSHFEIYCQTYDVLIKTKFIHEHSACQRLHTKLTFYCGFLLSIPYPFHLIFHCSEPNVLD